MAQKLPPLPPGFSVVEDETTVPPVPAGFTEVSEGTTPKYKKPANQDEYETEIKRMVKSGADIATVRDYANFAEAEAGDKLTNRPDDNGWKMIEGVITEGGRRNFSFNKETPAIGKIAKGFVRGTQHVVEGAGQLGIRAGDAIGAISDEKSAELQQNLGTFAENADNQLIEGKLGEAGAMLGETLPTLAVPFAAPRAGARLLSLANAARGAKLAAGGAAVGAMTGAEKTAGEQDANALLGAATSALGVPLLEGLVNKVGVPLARKFYDRWQTGLGKKLFDETTGALTAAGRLFRVRLKHASPGIDDELIDAALQQIKVANPKRLPADENVVAEVTAKAQKVPLTRGMKTRNAQEMGDLASTAAGARGVPIIDGNAQKKALKVDADIDEAILSNVEAVKGTDTSTAVAEDDIIDAVGAAADAARRVKNAAYEPLNKSSERIVKPTALLGVHDDFVSAVGETGFKTLQKTEPVTAAYAKELRELGRKGTLPFGELWSLDKRIKKALRDPNTAAANGSLSELGKKVRGFIDSAPAEVFESGERGVFDQLKRANAANREYATRFKSQNRVGLTDTVGKKIEAITAIARNPAQRSEARVAEMVFGRGKALGNKETEAVVKRLVKANPATQQPLREVALNRVITQMEDATARISGKRAINPAAASKVLDEVVTNNARTLKALGLTDADLTTLKQNAYLASLKIRPQGARAKGSSDTNKAIGANFATILRQALFKGGPFAGMASLGGGGNLVAALGAAGVTALGVGTASRRVTNRAINTKALPASKVASETGQKVRNAVSRTLRGLASQDHQ